MHAPHARDAEDHPLHLARGDAGGGALEQDVARVADHAPGAPEDEERDHRRYDRVGELPAGGQDDERRGDDADGAEHVGEHVPQRGLDVQRLAARAGEDGECRHVDDEPSDGHDEHPAAEHLRRVGQPSHRLEQHPGGDEHEQQPVEERGDDLGAPVAEAAVGRGGAPREPDRPEREQQREDVREHVTGVGEQRQAVGRQPAGHLGHRVGGEQHQRPAEGARAGVRVTVRVVVGVAVRHGLQGACPVSRRARRSPT